MSMVFKTLLVLMMAISFNMPAMASEDVIIEYGFPYIKVEEKERLMFPYEYKMYLDDTVFEQVEKNKGKELAESERIFKTEEWQKLKKEFKALEVSTQAISPAIISKVLMKDVELIQIYAEEIERINAFTNSEEAKVLLIHDINVILNICNEMTIRVLQLEDKVKFGNWWEQLFKTSKSIYDFLDDVKPSI